MRDEKIGAFATRHPAVPALFSVLALAWAMLGLQPVLVAIALASGLAYLAVARGLRAAFASLRWQLPLILIIAVVNPIFSASGSTEVARIGEWAIYLESLVFGGTMGGLAAASALWLQIAAALVPFDKVMALAGNVAPVVALMVSQCMRLIPRFARQGRQVLAVQRVAHPTRALGAVRARLRMSTVLMGWTLEDSLETADAMRARGWGAAPRRTVYTRYRFTRTDAVALAAVAVAGVVAGALALTATDQFAFYPRLTQLVAWWGYVPYALWMLVPTVLEVREKARFR